MPTSEKELDAKRASVDKLRQQVEDARQARLAAEAEVGNDVTLAQLEAEEALLQVELDREKESAKRSNVSAAVDVMLNAAEEQKKQAAAMAQADADQKATAEKAAADAKAAADKEKAAAAKAKATTAKDKE